MPIDRPQLWQNHYKFCPWGKSPSTSFCFCRWNFLGNGCVLCSSGECSSICFVSDCWWWLGSMKKRQICARSQGSCCSYLIFVFFWHHHYFKLKIWHWKHVNLNTTEHLSTATAACGACDKYQVCWCWCIGGKKKLHEKLTNTLAKLLKKLPKKIWFQRKICKMLLSAERIHLV